MGILVGDWLCPWKLLLSWYELFAVPMRPVGTLPSSGHAQNSSLVSWVATSWYLNNGLLACYVLDFHAEKPRGLDAIPSPSSGVSLDATSFGSLKTKRWDHIWLCCFPCGRHHVSSLAFVYLMS